MSDSFLETYSSFPLLQFITHLFSQTILLNFLLWSFISNFKLPILLTLLLALALASSVFFCLKHFNLYLPVGLNLI